MAQALEARPDLNRGDRVSVREPGIGSWLGTVTDVKLGAGVWRVSVRRDTGGGTWVLPASMVRREGASE